MSNNPVGPVLSAARHTYAPPSADSGIGPLILVAEDDSDALRIVSTMLLHAGYRVAEATTGSEALVMARELRPALIVMDVEMPGLDGWEVTRRVRADPDAEVRGTRILALTARAFSEDREMARTVGCDGFLAKPADVRLVVRSTQQLLAGELLPEDDDAL